MIVTIFEPATGRPVCQYAWSGGLDTAPDQGYPDHGKILTGDDGLSRGEVWVVDGHRVPRDGVAAAETLASEAARAAAEAAALAAAENAAPRPTVAASASQQTFHAILRVVAPLAQGEPPAQADIDHLAALAAKFAGATSNLPDADAESYVAAALAKADAAMDVYTKGGE